MEVNNFQSILDIVSLRKVFYTCMSHPVAYIKYNWMDCGMW